MWVKKSGRHIVGHMTWEGQQSIGLVTCDGPGNNKSHVFDLCYLKSCMIVIILNVWKNGRKKICKTAGQWQWSNIIFRKLFYIFSGCALCVE